MSNNPAVPPVEERDACSALFLSLSLPLSHCEAIHHARWCGGMQAIALAPLAKPMPPCRRMQTPLSDCEAVHHQCRRVLFHLRHVPHSFSDQGASEHCWHFAVLHLEPLCRAAKTFSLWCTVNTCLGWCLDLPAGVQVLTLARGLAEVHTMRIESPAESPAPVCSLFY